MDRTHSTDRLNLRPLTLDDAPAIEKYCSDFEVAKTTLSMPHPYPEGYARTWIEKALTSTNKIKSIVFGIVPKDKEELIGCIGLIIELEHKRAEMGYWIGKPYWGQGYATEAARKILEIGFREYELNHIKAGTFTNNPASNRVIEKIGMKHEATFRKHVLRWGEFMDLSYYGILKEEYDERKG